MSQFCCTNCQSPMRALALAGHYKRPVDIDICEDCSLIWFEGTQSIKLAGPGIADLVHAIHAALAKSTANTLANHLACPACATPLVKVFNLSRFGRTQQWQCPQGHGYFQTFVLYLAEKGFVHKMGWADLKQQVGSKRQLFCAGCGAVLDNRRHDACPYCLSAVGVIDPARLASAIDIQQAATVPVLPTEVVQSKCWSCGGIVNATQESHCSHCHVIVKKIDSQSAADASTAVEEKVRQNYHRQLPAVSSKKLQDVAAQQAWMSAVVNRMDDRQMVTREQLLKWAMVLVPAVLLLTWLLVQWQTREPAAPATVLQAAIAAPTVQAPPSALPAPASDPTSINTTAAPVAQALQLSDGPSVEQMFSFPAMECAADAKARSRVKIRQILLVPMASENLSEGRVDNRKAFVALQRARQELVSGVAFAAVLQGYGAPTAENANPNGFYLERGSGKREIERAAFCLPVHTISPIFKSAAGFHLIEVLEVR